MNDELVKFTMYDIMNIYYFTFQVKLSVLFIL